MKKNYYQTLKVIALMLSYKNVESKKTSFDRETTTRIDFIEGLGVDDELIDVYNNDINALDTVQWRIQARDLGIYP